MATNLIKLLHIKKKLKEEIKCLKKNDKKNVTSRSVNGPAA
jgi:hypothetical protein